MSYLDNLKDSRKKPQVAYIEFVLHTKREKWGLFCFFEGKDNAYYVPRIKQFTEYYFIINCGGRDAVLKVYQLILKHSEYIKYHKAFFIDRDFNPPLAEYTSSIFETPCYSIENFYASVTAFEEILKNSLHLSSVSEDYQTCVALFKKRQEEYHQATLLFNAWYACLIAIRNATGIDTGVRLDDKLPKHFVEIDLQQVKSNYDRNKIIQTYPKALAIDIIALEKKLLEFSNCEQHKVFRGKYELEFVITFIDLLIKDSKENKQYVKKKIDFAFTDALNHKRALEVFASYADTPSELNIYLKQVTQLLDNKNP